jgi:hypothetical protein
MAQHVLNTIFDDWGRLAADLLALNRGSQTSNPATGGMLS